MPSLVSIHTPASGAAEAQRWAVPQPQRGPAMRVACRQRWRVGAGSRRCSVGGFLKAAAVGRHRLRRAAGQRGAAGHSRRAYRPHVRWAPARRPAAHAAAQPRSQQTPLARPQTWAFFTMRLRAVARLGLSGLPAALLKRVVGPLATRMPMPNYRMEYMVSQPYRVYARSYSDVYLNNCVSCTKTASLKKAIPIYQSTALQSHKAKTAHNFLYLFFAAL